MSGTSEQLASISRNVLRIEKKALETARHFVNTDSKTLERLINLELAFHIWQVHYHWLEFTSFDYSILEQTIAKLLVEPHSLPLTSERRQEFKDRPDGILKLSTRHVQTSFKPSQTELEQFENDLETVKTHANNVARAIQNGDEVALQRFAHLEVAFYLWYGYLGFVKSTSPRWKRLRSIVKTLRQKPVKT